MVFINIFNNKIQSTSYSLAEIASALNSEYPGMFDYWTLIFHQRIQGCAKDRLSSFSAFIE